MKITLTLTTSKRLELFEQTINSFVLMCEDIGLINEIYHYDDSSSYEDRKKMYMLIRELFPTSKLVTQYFDENSFEDRKRHARIMRIWKDNLYYTNNHFLFHLEDDWKFIQKFNLSDAIKILERPNVNYVGFSQQLRELPEKYNTEISGNFWMWIYDKDKPLQDNLFLDSKEMESHPNPNYWCYFINWPHFSLRPGVHKVSELISMGNFSVDDVHFELEFALRYSKNFVSFNHVEKIVDHIGWDKSSYDLNNSLR